MTQQSGCVNKLERVREKLCNSNCCFDICRVSFKSASNHTVRGGGGTGVCVALWNYIQEIHQSVQQHYKLQRIVLLQLSLNRTDRQPCDAYHLILLNLILSFNHCKNTQWLIFLSFLTLAYGLKKWPDTVETDTSSNSCVNTLRACVHSRAATTNRLND